MTPIIFIGMAGVGKTTIAKALAKKLSRPFIDTDVLISEDYGQPLHDIIQKMGPDDFIKTEAKYVTNNLKNDTILAPGGSIVYATDTMKHLQQNAIVIYLYDTPDAILNRIPDLESRGIIGLNNRSFHDLFAERHPLYKASSHVMFHVGHYGLTGSIDQVSLFIDQLS